jgi:hypothetical protein
VCSTLGFTILFSSFLLLFVNWSALNNTTCPAGQYRCADGSIIPDLTTNKCKDGSTPTACDPFVSVRDGLFSR